MFIVYAFSIIFMEDIMDDGDGETCQMNNIMINMQA